MIIYIDYFVIISISKQTIFNITNINKLNFHLICISQYLSAFNIELRYKVNKVNIVLNALSRLL